MRGVREMIMPNKNITVHHSLLHCGALILAELKDSDTISSLRDKTKNKEALSNYEKFILTLDYLYTIGAITLRDGLIVRCMYAQVNQEQPLFV
jgi:hypothetical protein